MASSPARTAWRSLSTSLLHQSHTLPSTRHFSTTLHASTSLPLPHRHSRIPPPQPQHRQLSTSPFATSPSPLTPPAHLSPAETHIYTILATAPELQPVDLVVRDISGGCGSMYAIDVVADVFRDMPVIRQHRLVNQVLGEEIKKWHGVQLKTLVPSTEKGSG